MRRLLFELVWWTHTMFRFSLMFWAIGAVAVVTHGTPLADVVADPSLVVDGWRHLLHGAQHT